MPDGSPPHQDLGGPPFERWAGQTHSPRSPRGRPFRTRSPPPAAAKRRKAHRLAVGCDHRGLASFLPHPSWPPCLGWRYNGVLRVSE